MNQPNASPTLDTLFQRILARKPDALALVDPSNKARITGHAPRRLTFAEADRAISALAAHFVDAGLPAHSVSAVQLPNTVEFALTVLAAHRAGLVVALFPLLWRQTDLVAALNRTSARAIVTSAKVDGVIHADLAMNAAAEAFSVPDPEAAARSTIETLPDILDAAGRSVPVMIDSGFRRGTDIYKALALGARAVGVGRPYIFGLSAFGQPGVERVLDILRAELSLTMRQCGTPTIKDITQASVGRRA